MSDQKADGLRKDGLGQVSSKAKRIKST